MQRFRRITRSLRPGLCVAAAAAAGACGSGASDPPELYLWAWQRAEDLSYIDPAGTKLALWVATFTLDSLGIGVEIRGNPLTLPEGTGLIAVIRIEAPVISDPTATDLLALEIRDFADSLGAGEVQIDFDAVVSQRDFYRRLIDELRERMPATRLSITALASWCFGDPWIETLPIDAAVPMYYRMGPDGRQIRENLAAGRQIPATICRDNAGYSLDEPGMPLVAARRVFVFSPEGWNEERYRETRAWLEAAAAD